MNQFQGVITALVTPFIGGEIDFQSLRNLIRFQLDKGIQGFVVMGTTGESPTLNAVEQTKIFEFVKSEVAGAVPLIMGTGTNSTRATVDATLHARTLGADAALVVVPYYNKPTQQGLFEHYSVTAEKSGLPVILYNVPGRTITALELETIEKLSRTPGILGIKEASGNIDFGKKILEKTGPGFLLSSGDDKTCLELAVAGGHGVISVCSHVFPAQMVEWMRRAREKDGSAQKEFTSWFDLLDHLYVESNPIPVKAALKHMGILRSDEMRLPLTRLSEKHQGRMKQMLEKHGVI